MHARRGQSLTEYALLVGLVIAAFAAMRLYLERGLKAELRKDADNLLGFAGSDDTQLHGFSTSDKADFTTTDDAQHTVQRAAVGGQVTQVVTDTGQTARFGFETFIQLDGPPAQNPK